MKKEEYELEVRAIATEAWLMGPLVTKRWGCHPV